MILIDFVYDYVGPSISSSGAKQAHSDTEDAQPGKITVV